MAHTEHGVAGVNRSDGFNGEGASLARELSPVIFFCASVKILCCIFGTIYIFPIICEHFSRLLRRIISVSHLKQALGGGPKRVPTIKPASFVPTSMPDNDFTEPSPAGSATSMGSATRSSEERQERRPNER